LKAWERKDLISSIYVTSAIGGRELRPDAQDAVGIMGQLLLIAILDYVHDG
jgi:hypothetical protein